MNWHDLSIILAVSRENSFSGAAKTLNVAHTTIGRRITDIETKLNTKLFIRTKISCIPTDDCRKILGAIERIEAETLSIDAYFKDYSKTPRGIVKVATLSWIMQDFIVPALPSFTAKYPNIELQLIADTRERSIAEHETNLSLGFELQQINMKMSTLDLAEFSYSVYAPDVENPHMLKWVTFWEDHFHYQPDNWLRQKTIDVGEVSIRANDAGMLLGAIRGGVGKGLIPDFLGANDTGLVRLSGPNPEIVRTLKLSCQSGVRNLSHIDAVVTWLRDVFKTNGTNAA